MKRIIIETIDVNEQRYPTCGDYWETDSEIHIKVSTQIDERSEVLVAVHELIEFFLTKHRGIEEPDIMKFDLLWEERNKQGKAIALEPGNEPDAPYRKEHIFAENIERLFAAELDVDWDIHDEQLIYQQNGRKEGH